LSDPALTIWLESGRGAYACCRRFSANPVAAVDAESGTTDDVAGAGAVSREHPVIATKVTDPSGLPAA